MIHGKFQKKLVTVSKGLKWSLLMDQKIFAIGGPIMGKTFKF